MHGTNHNTYQHVICLIVFLVCCQRPKNQANPIRYAICWIGCSEHRLSVYLRVICVYLFLPFSVCLFHLLFVGQQNRLKLTFIYYDHGDLGISNPFATVLFQRIFFSTTAQCCFLLSFPRPLLDVMTHCIATSNPHAVFCVWLSLCGVIANATILPIPYSFGWNEILLCGFFWFLCFRYVQNFISANVCMYLAHVILPCHAMVSRVHLSQVNKNMRMMLIKFYTHTFYSSNNIRAWQATGWCGNVCIDNQKSFLREVVLRAEMWIEREEELHERHKQIWYRINLICS